MKKIKYLVLILLLILIFPLKTNALNVYFPTLSDGDGSSEGDGKISGNSDLGEDAEGNIYKCNFKYKLNGGIGFGIELYDIHNNRLDNDISITLNKAVPAGTSVGLYIAESKTIGYTISESDIVATQIEIKPEEKTFTGYLCKYNCGTVKMNACPFTYTKETGEVCVQRGVPEAQYKIEKGSTNTITLDSSHSKYEECKGDAIAAAQSAAGNLRGSSFKTELTNSNDIKDEVKEVINNVDESGRSSFNSNSLSDSITLKYSYNMSKVCLNVKTSKVSYKTESQECSKDEILIANDTIGGKTHWHYFVPLNSKSTDEIVIELSKKVAEKLDVKTCNNAIEIYKKNKEYLDVIVPLGNNKYTGDPHNDKKITKSANGCRQVSIIRIPVIQEFYAEQKKQSGEVEFKGKKLYFRRINIENPFNYKLEDQNSLWYDWYNENYDSSNKYVKNNGTPNIKKSFDSWSYRSIVIDAKDVKTKEIYERNTRYYSWTDMLNNGTSCLIKYANGGRNQECQSSGGTIPVVAERNTNLKEPYKLGQGPGVKVCNVNGVETAYIGDDKEC